MPAETATAVCCVLMGGVLQRFPKLKVDRYFGDYPWLSSSNRFALHMEEELFPTPLVGSSMDTRWTNIILKSGIVIKIVSGAAWPLCDRLRYSPERFPRQDLDRLTCPRRRSSTAAGRGYRRGSGDPWNGLSISPGGGPDCWHLAWQGGDYLYKQININWASTSDNAMPHNPFTCPTLWHIFILEYKFYFKFELRNTSLLHEPLTIIMTTFQVIAESDFSSKTKKKLLWDNAMSFLNLDQTKFWSDILFKSISEQVLMYIWHTFQPVSFLQIKIRTKQSFDVVLICILNFSVFLIKIWKVFSMLWCYRIELCCLFIYLVLGDTFWWFKKLEGYTNRNSLDATINQIRIVC